jgi:hypothetical protein
MGRKKKTSFKLSPEWMLKEPIDFEYNKYTLLDYLQKCEKRFNNLEIYPDFVELSLHLANIQSLVKENTLLLTNKKFESCDDEILVKELVAKKPRELTKDEEGELDKTIRYSGNRLFDAFNAAKSIWNLAYDNLDISIKKNKKNLSGGLGYIYFYNKEVNKVMVWQYEIKKPKGDRSNDKTYLKLIHEGQPSDITLLHIIETFSTWTNVEGFKEFPIFAGKIDSSTMAKNELLNNLKDTEYDSVVFINDDLAWDPISFIACVLSKEDVVALPVVKKTLGNVVFDLDMDTSDIEKNDEGLIKVKHASTGFLKISNKVMTELIDGSISVTNNTGNEVKNVFEFQVKDGQFFNDSVVLCHKIKDMGYDIWLNPQTTCAQLTDNLYAVDFATALDSNLNPEVPNTDTVTPAEGSTGATDAPKDDGIKSLYE